jgi:drug/metabolite transporter (DMT)-like permease
MRVWIICFWIGAFGNALPFSLIGWGEVRIDSGLAAILMAVMPLATLVLAHLFTDDERMNGWRATGVLLGLAGVVVLIGVDALAGLGDDVWRQFAVAGGAVCYAIATIFTRRLPPAEPAPRGAAVMICASLQMVPLAILVERPDTIAPSADSLIALAYLGIVATAAATIVYFVLVAARGATFFSFINYLIPVVGVAWGLIFLNEHLSPQSIAALVLILAGIAIANRGPPAERNR